MINAATAAEVVVNGQSWHESLVLPARGDVLPWLAERLEDLTAAHFEQIAAAAPELVIFGSGPRLRFASPALLRPLIERRIGVETMDTAAACRTYNILVSEGRNVLAALILTPPKNEAANAAATA